MAAFALHALALLFLEDNDLLTALVLKDFGLDRCAGEEGGADLKSVALASGEDFVDLDSGAGFRLGIAVYDEDIALSDRELLPLRFDSGFHKYKGRNKVTGSRVSKDLFSSRVNIVAAHSKSPAPVACRRLYSEVGKGMPLMIQPVELQSRGTVALARWLLGKVLIRTTPSGRSARVICEVEAYDGERDLACHASKGRTKRTEVMYQAGGVWYVYLCYGVHEMLNLVTGPANYPAAVLIRGVHGILGPGRLTKQLQIGRTLNGAPARPESGLHLEDHGIKVPRRWILAGPRVGVDYAGREWSAKPWRFRIDPAFLSTAVRLDKPVRPVAGK